jgi:acetolactate synthase regulatory subunit
MTMRQHQFQIQLRDSEGAVLRTLGMIERRGFRLDSLQVGEVTDTGRAMAVVASSIRPGDLLKRQLERLHDVVQVDIRTPANWAGSTSKTG